MSVDINKWVEQTDRLLAKEPLQKIEVDDATLDALVSHCRQSPFSGRFDPTRYDGTLVFRGVPVVRAAA